MSLGTERELVMFAADTRPRSCASCVPVSVHVSVCPSVCLYIHVSLSLSACACVCAYLCVCFPDNITVSAQLASSRCWATGGRRGEEGG